MCNARTLNVHIMCIFGFRVFQAAIIGHQAQCMHVHDTREFHLNEVNMKTYSGRVNYAFVLTG